MRKGRRTYVPAKLLEVVDLYGEADSEYRKQSEAMKEIARVAEANLYGRRRG